MRYFKGGLVVEQSRNLSIILSKEIEQSDLKISYAVGDDAVNFYGD